MKDRNKIVHRGYYSPIVTDRGWAVYHYMRIITGLKVKLAEGLVEWSNPKLAEGLVEWSNPDD